MFLHYFWQYIKSHFHPTVLHQTRSKHNGAIQVVEVSGSRRIMVGGYIQSGGFLELLWQRSLRRLRKKSPAVNPKTVAIFGFAGGSAARAVKTLWPNTLITGVDIDPVMVKLGQTYFDTRSLTNTNVEIADVFSWIKTTTSSFDLILIDLFKGGDIPDATASEAFIDNLYKITASTGYVMVNYFPHETNAANLHRFDRLVKKRFDQVSVANILAEKIYILNKT
jgi:spermidine synthase